MHSPAMRPAEADSQTQTLLQEAATTDRRRLGRRDDLNPELLPLLRGDLDLLVPLEPVRHSHNGLSRREEWIVGIGVAAILMLTGTALRFCL